MEGDIRPRDHTEASVTCACVHVTQRKDGDAPIRVRLKQLVAFLFGEDRTNVFTPVDMEHCLCAILVHEPDHGNFYFHWWQLGDTI